MNPETSAQPTDAGKPRPSGGMSVPGLLALLQNEWDSTVLELSQMRKQLEEVQQELSHALYQNDAACRVIARLLKERDQARQALAQMQASSIGTAPAPTPVAASAAAPPPAEAPETAAMEVEAPKGISADVVAKMQATQKQLSAQRKSRSIPATLATPEAIATMHCTSTHPLHKTTQPGVSALALHSDSSLIATGGVDGQVIVFNGERRQVAATLAGHSKKITDVAFHGAAHTLFSASADRTVRVWGESQEGAWEQRGVLGMHGGQPVHQGDITGLALHPLNDYVVAGALDGTWAFYDVAAGAALAVVTAPVEAAGPKKSGIEAVQFHPDGLILGTGAGPMVKLWDVKTQANVAKCEDFASSVKTVAFSENGFYLASAAADNTVRLFDLRKLNKQRANFRTLTLPEDYVVQHVSFDYSGSYLVVAGNDVRVYNTKTWAELAVLRDHEQAVTRAFFGKDAATLASASMDRTLRLWAPAAAPAPAATAAPKADE